MKFNAIYSTIILSAFSQSLFADSILSDIPSDPDSDSKYIFYLHGSVEEEQGSTEKYESAIEAISDSDAIVISEVRNETDPNAYALKLKEQVNKLISKGVPASNITISGFSKGSIITLASASEINNKEINYVLLAGCSEYLNKKYNINISSASGRILSIYDSGDEKFGSCKSIIKESADIEFKETELDSGKGHKVFRIPKEKFIEQWRDPLIDWAEA